MAKKYVVDLNKIDWRFTVLNARDKLEKLYPAREEQ